MSNRFTLEFDPKSPELEKPNFEVTLATKLLQALRQWPCSPDPVPYINETTKNSRMIGAANNFWLTRISPSEYLVEGRYAHKGDVDHAALRRAEDLIRDIYSGSLLPEPTDRNAVYARPQIATAKRAALT